MQHNTISYKDFALRVQAITQNNQFQAIDTVTGKVLFFSDTQPYNTMDGADAFFKALYNCKKTELN